MAQPEMAAKKVHLKQFIVPGKNVYDKGKPDSAIMS